MSFVGSQPRFKILVANLSAPTSAKGVPAPKLRAGFQMSMVPLLGRPQGMLGGTMATLRTVSGTYFDASAGIPVRPTAALEVVSNTFAGNSALLAVGPFTLVSHVHFVPGGGVAATATALAAAISALPGYTATPAGAVVTVQGPRGALGIQVQFSAKYTGGEANYRFTWPSVPGELGYTSTPLVGAEILDDTV